VVPAPLRWLAVETPPRGWLDESYGPIVAVPRDAVNAGAPRRPARCLLPVAAPNSTPLDQPARVVDLADVIRQYGYPAVFLGALLEGETIVALAGLASHRGYLSFQGAIAVATMGGFLGDQLYFALGRWFGGRILHRYPRLTPTVARANELLERYQAWLIVGVRFMYGFRIAGPLAIGMSRIHWVRFAALNLLGALLWAVAVTSIGYVVGDALERLLGDLERIELWAFITLGAAGVVVWLLRRRRRQKSLP
jgi:membrane protein DedA with SNARE-associated domain